MSYKESDKSKCVNFVVTNVDGVASSFRIKRNTKLKAVMGQYCEQFGTPRLEVVFVYANGRVEDEDTFHSLCMKDGDAIKVFRKSDAINIGVIGSAGVVNHFRVKREIMLKEVMEAYCQQNEIPRSKARFFYNGYRIKEEDTIQSLDIEESCTIDFCHEQVA